MAQKIIPEINYDAAMQPVESFRIVETPGPGRGVRSRIRHNGSYPFVSNQSACWCAPGTRTSSWGRKDNIDLLRCEACGTIRVSRIDAGVVDQYANGSYHAAPPRGEAPFVERFRKDLAVAKSRLAKLQPWVSSGQLLDVGCGNGAFVEAALAAGYDAWGTDLSTFAAAQASAKTRQRLRKAPLEGAGFPRRSLDVVTMFDVLEHLPDPVGELRLAAVLLKREGLLVVELPDCDSEDARRLGAAFHHVKPREHLWYFGESQFRQLAEAAGYFVVGVDRPIPNKMTFTLAPVARREKIRLVGPPGIGDVHWVLLKARDLARREAPCELTVVIQAKGDPRHAERSREFLELVPWVDRIEFVQADLVEDVGCLDVLSAEYRWIANTHLESGRRIEDWHPEYAADFDYDVEIPEADRALARRLRQMAGGKLVVFYPSSVAWNVACLGRGVRASWGPPEWVTLGRMVRETFGVRPVLIGKDWDTDYLEPFRRALALEGQTFESSYIDMVGKTSVGLAAALMAESAVTVGMCAGITILGVHLKAPSVMFWPEAAANRSAQMQFHKDFQTDWVSPEWLASGKYRSKSLGRFSVHDVFADVCQLMEGH